MKQTIVLFTILISLVYAVRANADVSWANSNDSRPVTHLFVGDETLWFLAQVYYGNGEQYKKIMDANKLSSPQKVSEGTNLIIPNPKFLPSDANFAKRYSSLNDKRMKLLAAQGSPLAPVGAVKAASSNSQPEQSVRAPRQPASTIEQAKAETSQVKQAPAEKSKADFDKLALVRSFASISESAPKPASIDKAKSELDEAPASRVQRSSDVKKFKAE